MFCSISVFCKMDVCLDGSFALQKLVKHSTHFINVFSLQLWGILYFYVHVLFHLSFCKIDTAWPALSLLKTSERYPKCILCSLVRYSLLLSSCFVQRRFLQNWPSLASSFSMLKHMKPFTYFRNALFVHLWDVFLLSCSCFLDTSFCKFEVGPFHSASRHICIDGTLRYLIVIFMLLLALWMCKTGSLASKTHCSHVRYFTHVLLFIFLLY